MRLLRTPSPVALEGMLPNPATCLARLNAERLKKIARRWVGKDANKLNKEGALQAVTHGLGDPRAIRAVVAGLSDFERAGLGLIKARGGRAAYTEELVGELLMFDLPFAGKQRYGGFHDGVGTHFGPVNALLDTGLIIRIDGSGERISSYDPGLGVYSDAKVLAAVDPLVPLPLAIKPQPGPPAGSVRRPTEVLLECLALARVLSAAPPIPVTARGLRSKSALARIGKPLGWKEHAASLPNALGFYLSLFEAAGLLREVPEERLLGLDRAHAEAALAEPYPEQARRWARAYRALLGWCEAMPVAIHFYANPDDPEPSTFNALRAALLLGLGALPEADAWYGSRTSPMRSSAASARTSGSAIADTSTRPMGRRRPSSRRCAASGWPRNGGPGASSKAYGSRAPSPAPSITWAWSSWLRAKRARLRRSSG